MRQKAVMSEGELRRWIRGELVGAERGRLNESTSESQKKCIPVQGPSPRKSLFSEGLEDVKAVRTLLRVLSVDAGGPRISDLLTDIRGIQNVITVKRVGPARAATPTRIVMQVDIGWEDDTGVDLADLERELMSLVGVDLVRVRDQKIQESFSRSKLAEQAGVEWEKCNEEDFRLNERELRQLIRNVMNSKALQLKEAAGPTKLAEIVSRLEKINEILDKYGARVGVRVLKLMSARTIVFAIDMGQQIRHLTEQEYAIKALDDIKKNSDFFSEKEYDLLRNMIPWGSIETTPVLYDGPCKATEDSPVLWKVVLTRPTLKSWGPLLYDLAIEFATENGGGLMSDRKQVSSDALQIWQRYDDSRPDVTSYQLDVRSDTAKMMKVKQITPETWDDCIQDSAIKHMGSDWDESPLSRVYAKSPVLTAQLESLGLLWR